MISLYRATDGPNWNENANWLSERPISHWHGVRVNGQGRVTELILRDNGLNGEIPADIGRLSELNKVVLSGNQLAGEIPSEFGAPSNLKHLDLSQNRLTGEIPLEIGEVSNLTHLLLNQNQLSGGLPANLSGLTKLFELDLSDNDLTGEIPPELGRLPDLRYLGLATNRVSGVIPPELGNLSNLRVLFLVNNRLRGAVPRELGQLSNLEILRLDKNRLSGAIPPELGKLSKLTGFEILENQLSGEIPPELADLKQLRTLFLSRNPRLSGCMPDELLDIEINDFEHLDLQPCDALERAVLADFFEAMDGDNWTNSDGWISDAPLGQWHGVSTDRYGRVVSLDLTDNGVSGEIPQALNRLTKLQDVRLGGSRILGCIPLALLSVPDNDFDGLGVPECSVQIPDYYFRTALKEALGKDPGAEIYADDLKSLVELTLDPYGFRNLEGLQYAENLISLTLGVSSQPLDPNKEGFPNRIHDLSPLSGMTKLKVLNLARVGAQDLSPLAMLTSLEHLDVGYNGVKDLTSVAALPRLETIIAPDNNIDDLTGLDGAGTLKDLDVSDNDITDISQLAGLTSLERLNISHNDIGDLSALTDLASLERLEIKNVGIAEIPPLDGLSNLKHLDIGWNEIADLSPLSGSNGLETLIAGPNDLGDIKGVQLPGGLQHLQLAGANISDLSLIQGLSNLRDLVVPNNRIADLSPISALENLEFLDISFNEVEELTPLSDLTKLRNVVVVGNPVGGIGPLAANTGFAAGARLEVDEELFERVDTTGDYRALERRGVELAIGQTELTAYSRPVIFNDNVFVLPFLEGLLSLDLSLPEIVNMFYEEMEDVFDFVMIVSNLRPGEDRTRIYSGKSSGVSNDVEGIGRERFIREEWGSASELETVLHFPANNAIRHGPVLHELMHRWANYVVEPIGHWLFSSVGGTVGGFEIANLIDLGGGRYTAGGFGPGGIGWNGIPYPMLELYLAGLATPDEVPDWVMGVDGDFARDAQGMIERYDDGEVIFTAKELKPFSIDYIIDRHGTRVPGFESSQKEFRAAVILLIDEEHPATTTALTALSDHVRMFSHAGPDDDDGYFNFFEATLGRAQMVMGGLSEFRLEAAAK